MARSSFSKYLTKHYSGVLYEAVSSFLKDPSHVVYDHRIKQVTAYDTPESSLLFDVFITSESIFLDEGIVSIASCSMDLEEDNPKLHILKIQSYSESYKAPYPKLCDDLVPLLDKESYEQKAMEIVKLLDSKSLETAKSINLDGILKKIGLEVYEIGISEDASIFGELFFNTAEAQLIDLETGDKALYDVSAKSILLDPRCERERSQAALNQTIAHEIVHYLIHRKTAALMRLESENNAPQIACRLANYSAPQKYLSTQDWVEKQARAIAPRLLMPRCTFESFARKAILKQKKLHPTTQTIDLMPSVIEAVSNVFCVSKQSCAIRMKEVGIDEALGVLDFIDGAYVKPYSYAKGTLKPGETYTISLFDALAQALTNKELSSTLASGQFLYLDSHYVLNNPKFITMDSGSAEMTDYARLHVDECCLKFKRVYKTPSASCAQFSFLSKQNDHDAFFSYDEASQNEDLMLVAEEAVRYAAFCSKEVELIGKEGFRNSLTRFMKEKKMTVEKLAEIVNVSERTISSLRNEANYNYSKELLVAICLSLHLNPEISESWLGRSHWRFNLDNEEDCFFHWMLRTRYNCDFNANMELADKAHFSLRIKKRPAKCDE